MLNLTVTWRDKWQWWHGKYPSRYSKGAGVSAVPWVSSIYKHKETGQIRLYSDLNMHGELVSINGTQPVRLESRGRFGKLYLSV